LVRGPKRAEKRVRWQDSPAYSFIRIGGRLERDGRGGVEKPRTHLGEGGFGEGFRGFLEVVTETKLAPCRDLTKKTVWRGKKSRNKRQPQCTKGTTIAGYRRKGSREQKGGS